jgi:hypothetical protein
LITIFNYFFRWVILRPQVHLQKSEAAAMSELNPEAAKFPANNDPDKLPADIFRSATPTSAPLIRILRLTGTLTIST